MSPAIGVTSRWGRQGPRLEVRVEGRGTLMPTVHVEAEKRRAWIVGMGAGRGS